MPSTCCQCWFEKQPEGQSGRSGESLGVRSGQTNDDETTGLHAPTGTAIPIAPLHYSVEFTWTSRIAGADVCSPARRA